MVQYEVFISYSKKDTNVADKICEALDRAEISYFIDRQGIGGGLEFPEVLARAIKNCKIFLLLASANAYASKFTKKEITYAFNKKPANTILPYIIDDSEMPEALEFVFCDINWRTMKEHPVDSVLIYDILSMLGRNSKTAEPPIEKQLSPEELFNKGLVSYNAGDYTEAVKWFRKAAETGNVSAQYNLGICYEYGKGVEKNYTEAVKWYRRAADAGDPDAQCNLGYCYDYGHGVEKNHTEAVKWYRRAADAGDPDAQCNLGICYEYGQGVEKNYTEAVKWYRRAADAGHPDAQSKLESLLKKM